MPKALTKQAAARPLVSASRPTAMGIRMRHGGDAGSRAPPSSDWKSSHSEAKPLSGGSAEIAAAPTRKANAVHRHPLDQAAHLLHVPRAGRLERPRPPLEEQQALEAGVVERVVERGGERQRGDAAAGRTPRKSSAAPMPMKMIPMFSMEWYASSRLRSCCISA